MSGQGAGNVPAGSSAGSQAGITGSPIIVPQPLPPTPAAVNWDAYQRTFTELADGTALPVHPVDQQVQTILTIEQGAIPSLGAVGQRYRKRLRGASPQRVLNIVVDETNVALSDLITAGDVRLGRITVDQSVRSRYIITVNYQNLRAPGGTNNTQGQSVQVAVGSQ